MTQQSAPASGGVDIWSIALDRASEEIEALSVALSLDERSRATRFRFEQHRSRFIVARASLRAILGGYLRCEPQEVAFCYNDYGKPGLLTQSSPFVSHRALQFNLAHSQDLALCAVAFGRCVGIDVEYLQSLPDALAIATRYFTERECRALREQSPEDQAHAFLRIWTCKEAYFKATGEGIAQNLEHVEVALPSAESAALCAVHGSEEKARDWWAYSFTPHGRYVAALVVAGEKQGISFRTWQ